MPARAPDAVELQLVVGETQFPAVVHNTKPASVTLPAELIGDWTLDELRALAKGLDALIGAAEEERQRWARNRRQRERLGYRS